MPTGKLWMERQKFACDGFWLVITMDRKESLPCTLHIKTKQKSITVNENTIEKTHFTEAKKRDSGGWISIFNG